MRECLFRLTLPSVSDRRLGRSTYGAVVLRVFCLLSSIRTSVKIIQRARATAIHMQIPSKRRETQRGKKDPHTPVCRYRNVGVYTRIHAYARGPVERGLAPRCVRLLESLSCRGGTQSGKLSLFLRCFCLQRPTWLSMASRRLLFIFFEDRFCLCLFLLLLCLLQ